MGHGEGHDHEPHDGDEHDEETHDDPHGAPSRGGPPDPLDRLWLHPSELPVGPERALVASSAPSASRWFAPVLAGVAGALATVVILAATGTLNRDTTSPDSAAATGTTIARSSAVANATVLVASMVVVSVRDASGARRGSGISVRHGGEVLTSASLVGNSTHVNVVTFDGRSHRARIVGRDRTTDLMLLAFDATVPAAQLTTRRPTPGAAVWIVGAPAAGSSAPWMSAGVLSSADAVVTASNGPWTGGLLETDAASGAQAAGAALIDTSGLVTGIVLGRFNSGDTTYAVPIATATTVSEQLRDGGVARHGTLGFQGRDTVGGPKVTTVAPHGPAADAGVHAGDIVHAVDGRTVESVADVTAIVSGSAPGALVTLELRRGENALKVEVVLGAADG